MSKLKKLKIIQDKYSKELTVYVDINKGINIDESNALIEAVIYEVLNIIGK